MHGIRAHRSRVTSAKHLGPPIRMYSEAQRCGTYHEQLQGVVWSSGYHRGNSRGQTPRGISLPESGELRRTADVGAHNISVTLLYI